jgi:N-acetylglucosaminyl-diphospho-decaprenol L-rhamnosyltransferase
LNAGAENNAGADAIQVATILVNWRQPQRTLEAIHAVASQTQSSMIIVVDNGSNDDSVDFLQKLIPSGVRLVTRNMNGGFGAGVNEGLREAYSFGAKYAWLLNNDAIPEPDCLEKLILVAENDSKIGVVGARIIDLSGSVPDHAGTIMNSTHFTCTYSTSSEEMNSARFSWVTGACMLLNVSVLREIGEFDPRFFMYWEDADLSCRLKNAGYSIGVADEAVVIHQAGSSSNEIQLRRHEWHIHSQSLWVEKHFRPKAWGIIITYARNLIRSVLDRDWNRFSLTVRCLRDRISSSAYD